MTEIEKQTKKELMSYAHLMRTKQSYLAQAAGIRSDAGNMTREFSPVMAAGSGNLPAGQRALEALEKAAQKFDEKANADAQKVCDMLDVLYRIENPLYVRILQMRYIDWVRGGKRPTWETIARQLHYSTEYIIHAHRQALQAYHDAKQQFLAVL